MATPMTGVSMKISGTTDPSTRGPLSTMEIIEFVNDLNKDVTSFDWEKCKELGNTIRSHVGTLSLDMVAILSYYVVTKSGKLALFHTIDLSTVTRQAFVQAFRVYGSEFCGYMFDQLCSSAKSSNVSDDEFNVQLKKREEYITRRIEEKEHLLNMIRQSFNLQDVKQNMVVSPEISTVDINYFDKWMDDTKKLIASAIPPTFDQIFDLKRPMSLIDALSSIYAYVEWYWSSLKKKEMGLAWREFLALADLVKDIIKSVEKAFGTTFDQLGKLTKGSDYFLRILCLFCHTHTLIYTDTTFFSDLCIFSEVISSAILFIQPNTRIARESVVTLVNQYNDGMERHFYSQCATILERKSPMVDRYPIYVLSCDTNISQLVELVKMANKRFNPQNDKGSDSDNESSDESNSPRSGLLQLLSQLASS